MKTKVFEETLTGIGPLSFTEGVARFLNERTTLLAPGVYYLVNGTAVVYSSEGLPLEHGIARAKVTLRLVDGDAGGLERTIGLFKSKFPFDPLPIIPRKKVEVEKTRYDF